MLSLYSDVINGASAVPHDVSEALRNSGAEAVLDGPMFEKSDPSKPYSQQTSGTVEYRHYDLSGGINIPTSYPSRGITISVMPDGSTQAGNGSAVPPGARVSVQLYPALVINGAVQHVTDNGAASRAALVVLRDGRMAFAAGPSMQLSDFAQALAESGALYAGYTDGGGSTSLASTGFYTGSSEHRKVLTWLLAKAPQPGKAAGVSSQTASSLAIAALIVAVGAIVWSASRSKRASITRFNPVKRRLTAVQARRQVLSHMQDMLGGEGWDDPRLLNVMERWVQLPPDESKFDAAAQAEELVNEHGFDPRDALDEE